MRVTAPRDDEKSLANKQLELICRLHPFSFGSSLLLSGTLAIALWPLVNRTVLLAWLLSLWLVMAVCDVYLRRYLRQAREGIVDHEQWRTGMQVGAAITGLCWGISVLSIPASPTEPASMLMLFVLAGVTAFSGISMAAVPQAARAFLLPALLPVAFWLFSFGERLAFFMGMMTLGHLGLMLLFSRQPYRTIHGAEETRMWQLERKGMEDALATRERDFRSLAENLPDNIVRWDTQGRYMYINPVHERTLGISASDIIGAELPDSHEHVRAAIAQVVATGQVVELVRQPVLVDGELQIHEVSLAPECDADGRIVSVLCVGRDMTEAYRMQDALQEKFDRINELNDYLEVSARNLEEQATELEASQEQLKDALEFTQGVINAIPDSLFEVNRDGRYLNVWTQKPELLPAQKEVLLGKTIHEVLSPESAAIAMDSLREAEETGLSFGKVIRIDLPQGESWFEISASMKPGGTPSDTRFLVLSRDVTERRVMEAAREATLAEALRLAQLRSAFMAQMSHELRTPLNGILGYAQNLLMQSDALGEKQITGLRIIQNSGEHLLTLINGILDHAAIEADKFELFPGDIELEIFLGTIIGIIRVRAEQKNIAFNCAADAGLPAVVRGDAQRLRQVLLNLLANAVKFTDFGQVTLRVSYTAPSRLRFAVQDSGVGIAAEQLETIFQPFEQTGETHRRAGGTGLGLAISRKLVRLMGGDIKVESQPGAGSTFSFEIDMETVQSDTAPVNVAALAEQATTPVVQASSQLFAPPRQELDTLHGLALRGSMRDVMRHAQRLADTDGRYLPFAEQLRLLAKGFQTKALVNLLAAYREGQE